MMSSAPETCMRGFLLKPVGCAGPRKTPCRLHAGRGFVDSKSPLRRAGNGDDQYDDGDNDHVHGPTIDEAFEAKEALYRDKLASWPSGMLAKEVRRRTDFLAGQRAS